MGKPTDKDKPLPKKQMAITKFLSKVKPHNFKSRNSFLKEKISANIEACEATSKDKNVPARNSIQNCIPDQNPV